MEQLFNVILAITFGSILIMTYLDLFKHKVKLGEYFENGMVCIIVALPPLVFNAFIWDIIIFK